MKFSFLLNFSFLVLNFFSYVCVTYRYDTAKDPQFHPNVISCKYMGEMYSQIVTGLIFTLM